MESSFMGYTVGSHSGMIHFWNGPFSSSFIFAMDPYSWTNAVSAILEWSSFYVKDPGEVYMA